MTFSRVKPGEFFEPSATEHNAMLEAAMHHRQKVRNVVPGSAGIDHPERLTCKAKNSTGGSVTAFASGVITGMTITPSISSGVIRGIDAPVITVGGTTADADDRPVVFLAPTDTNKPATVCLAGLVPALVNVSNAGHEFAVLDNGERLKSSADDGPVRIIWAPGTGSSQLCFVLLGLGGSGGGGSDNKLVQFTLTGGWSGAEASADFSSIDGLSPLGSGFLYDPKGIAETLESGDGGYAMSQDGLYVFVQAACPDGEYV